MLLLMIATAILAVITAERPDRHCLHDTDNKDSTKSCCLLCEAGYYINSCRCARCPTGGYASKPNDRYSCKLCAKCEGPFHYKRNCTNSQNAVCGCTRPYVCSNGMNAEDCGRCVKKSCPDNEEYNEENDTCVQCPHGQHRDNKKHPDLKCRPFVQTCDVSMTKGRFNVENCTCPPGLGLPIQILPTTVPTESSNIEMTTPDPMDTSRCIPCADDYWNDGYNSACQKCQRCLYDLEHTPCSRTQDAVCIYEHAVRCVEIAKHRYETKIQRLTIKAVDANNQYEKRMQICALMAGAKKKGETDV